MGSVSVKEGPDKRREKESCVIGLCAIGKMSINECPFIPRHHLSVRIVSVPPLINRISFFVFISVFGTDDVTVKIASAQN